MTHKRIDQLLSVREYRGFYYAIIRVTVGPWTGYKTVVYNTGNIYTDPIFSSGTYDTRDFAGTVAREFIDDEIFVQVSP